MREYGDALKAHLYNAKLIVYTLILVVGVTQIIIREQFPELHPPWPVISGILIGVLIGVIFLPPLLLIRRRRTAKPFQPEAKLAMSLWKKIFAKDEAPDPEPFMEHPTGTFKNAIDAMEDAVRRLRKLGAKEWITFSAQGEGNGPDSYAFAEVRMLADQLGAVEKPLNIPAIIQAAQTGANALVPNGPHYSVANASPREVARLLDAIFRTHFGLRPFADERDDYAVGAEW